MDWPVFSGELLVGDAVTSAGYGRDFGGIVHRRPRAVLRASDVADIVAAVRYCHAHGIPVVARGQAHTTRGQCQRDGALIIDVRGLDEVGAPAGDRVRVGAGARWSSVVRRAFTDGLTPPVLTDYVELTVGGTLSVGGVGGQSFAHGLQVDNVIALEVVTNEGERVHCSAERDTELFYGCLGGLGRAGVIVEATLRLVPAPRRVRVRSLPYDDLATFLDAQHVLAQAHVFDYLCGNFLPPATAARGIAGWQLELQCAHDASTTIAHDLAATGARLDRETAAVELDWLAFVERLEAMVQAWRASGSWTSLHPWIDLFIARAHAEQLIGAALEELTRDDIGDGYVMTYPLLGSRRGPASPRMPDGELLFLFDILPTLQPHALAAFEQRCATMLRCALDRGATVYPIGYGV
ncbi:MAG TPA: FAD-binding protein [Nannocystaceae bacterium]|nr:FAD-binding protein [Nannocystaceae bacterium]